MMHGTIFPAVYRVIRATLVRLKEFCGAFVNGPKCQALNFWKFLFQYKLDRIQRSQETNKKSGMQSGGFKQPIHQRDSKSLFLTDCSSVLWVESSLSHPFICIPNQETDSSPIFRLFLPGAMTWVEGTEDRIFAQGRDSNPAPCTPQTDAEAG